MVCVQVVDEAAFRGVGGQSVRQLSMRSSHLSDAHLPALLALTRLTVLDIAINAKITGVDLLLNSLRSLESLDASSDSVLSLGRSPQPVSSTTLQVTSPDSTSTILQVTDFT